MPLPRPAKRGDWGLALRIQGSDVAGASHSETEALHVGFTPSRFCGRGHERSAQRLLAGGRVFRHGLIVARCALWYKSSGPEVLSPKSWCAEVRAMIVVRLVRPKERAEKQLGDYPQQ